MRVRSKQENAPDTAMIRRQTDFMKASDGTDGAKL